MEWYSVPMRTFWNFASAGSLTFGTHSLQQLGPLLLQRGLKRVFVVTDAHLQRAGVVASVTAALQSAHIAFEVFAGGKPEPDVTLAVEAYAAARAFRPEAVLGLGGGSNMDLAKFTGLLLTHGGMPADYFGHERVPGPILPVVCIPTTAGTGSEVSHSTVLTDTANQVKVSTLSRHLRPALALVDPVLTLSCPSKPTADSGIDALTHAIEAFTAIPFDKLDAAPTEPFPYSGRCPMGDVLAAEAIRLVGLHLKDCVMNPSDLAAREGMALAATLAGLAFSNCAVAVVHALEYPIGAAVHVSHGAGNGLLLPYVMRYNLPANPGQFARIAGLLGVATHGISETSAAEAGIAAVEQLRAAIGIPNRLREIGVRQDQLPGFAAKSFEIKRLMRLNPRPPTESDLLAILNAAY